MHLGYMKILLFHIKNTELPIILNDFNEKVRKMAEIIIEKPSMQKVIYKTFSHIVTLLIHCDSTRKGLRLYSNMYLYFILIFPLFNFLL